MKTIRLLSGLMAMVFFAFILSSCSDDSTTVETYTISGNVMYPDFSGSMQNAGGAVVFLKKNATEATTNYDLVTVADASGNYSFEGLVDGDYWLFANYDTENLNVPAGRINGAVFIGEGAMVNIAGANGSQNFGLASMGQSNALAVNTYEGGNWNQDWNHSNVDFSFPYDDNNATYTGRFSGLYIGETVDAKTPGFEMYIDFDPADLANSKLEGKVDGLAVKTDSPGGRDALFESDGTFWKDPTTMELDLGCISGYFGITSLDDADRYITFTSTSIVTYGDAYLATGNMVFNGQTGVVHMLLKYIPGYQATSRSGVLTNYASFQGQFKFAAKADYLISSGHVNDAIVTVDVSFQVNQPAE